MSLGKDNPPEDSWRARIVTAMCMQLTNCTQLVPASMLEQELAAYDYNVHYARNLWPKDVPEPFIWSSAHMACAANRLAYMEPLTQAVCCSTVSRDTLKTEFQMFRIASALYSRGNVTVYVTYRL